MKAAAQEALAWLVEKTTTDVTPWWRNSQWCLTSPPITTSTGVKWEMPDYFGVDARAIGLSQYFCPVIKMGSGSFYFGTFHDHNCAPLEGTSTYRMHVPANVQVREFWSLTKKIKNISTMKRQVFQDQNNINHLANKNYEKIFSPPAGL